jgi:L-alanine-DL-glutamate epimerase-like enolase superfamily enzyme
MRESDIRIVDADLDFREVKLDHPLVISGGAIDWFTVAVVQVSAVDRRGRRATGRGASVLSIPWSWPISSLSVEARDTVLRDLTAAIAHQLPGLEPADPIRVWQELSAALPALCASTGTADIPHLAAALALGAVDNACHDVWGRVAGQSVFSMYDEEHLTDDLTGALGADFTGRRPADFLAEPRTRLPVQHLAGAADPIDDAEADPEERSLGQWLRADGISHVKVKVLGRSPRQDAERILAVHQAAVGAGNGPVRLAVDPNEAYAGAEALGETLDLVAAGSSATAQAIRYVEQPISRDRPADPNALRAVSGRVPVLMDEGFTSLDQLAELGPQGWSGLVIKAGKGQTPALLAHSFARLRGLFVTVQDLTAVDLALEHSARLVASLSLSEPHLEYNSRQYAPDANAELARVRPDLVRVRDGGVRVPPPTEPGLGASTTPLREPA